MGPILDFLGGGYPSLIVVCTISTVDLHKIKNFHMWDFAIDFVSFYCIIPRTVM